MSRPRSLFAVILVIETLAVIAALWVLVARHRIEAANRTVEVVVDYDEVAILAAQSSRPLPAALEGLHSLGVTGVGIQEDTLETLVDRGRIAVYAVPISGQWVDSLLEIRGDNETIRRLAFNLDAKWSAPGPPLGPRPYPSGGAIGVRGPQSALERVGLGWDPRRLRLAREVGLEPIARPMDTPLVTEGALRQTFDEIAEAGMERVLFSGKFVLGFPGLLDRSAQLMKERRLEFCALDLDIQKGTAALGAGMQGDVIRTHSISEGEMLKQTPQLAHARFLRAARERNIRCLFVRLFLDQAAGDPWTLNEQYLRGLVEDLKAGGFTIGTAQPVPRFKPPDTLAVPIALAVAGAGIELLAFLFELPAVAWWILWLLGSILAAALVRFFPSSGVGLVALAAAVVLPTLGLITVRYDRLLQAGSSEGTPRRGLAQGLGVGLWAWLRASAFAITGGVLLAALLSSTPYMLQIDQFRGVKPAQLLPLVLVTFVYLGEGLRQPGRPGQWWRQVCGCWRGLLGRPMTIGAFGLLLAAAGFAVLWVLRTGNQPGMAPSGVETAFRRALEQVLVYRPRTKEFLLGHPALILAGVLAARGRRQFVWPLVIIGTLGQVSLVNSFCHIHSPIIGAALRSLYGMILGALIGTALAVIRPVGRMTDEGRGT